MDHSPKIDFSLSSSASTTQLLFWNGTYLHLQQVLQLKKIINSTQKVTRMMQKEKPKVHPLLLFVALFRKTALKQRIISAVFPRRVRVRLLHHNPRPKKMQMWKRKRVKGIRSMGAKFCWCDRWMERNDRSQVSIIKMLKQCNLQNLLVLSAASCSTTKQQIKSGLSSVTQWETHSICMIYLLRQMKSVSAHSSIRGKEKKGSGVSSSGGKCNLNQIWFCHNLFFPPLWKTISAIWFWIWIFPTSKPDFEFSNHQICGTELCNAYVSLSMLE